MSRCFHTMKGRGHASYSLGTHKHILYILALQSLPCSSKCGPWYCLELVRNVYFQTLSQMRWIKICILKRSPGDMYACESKVRDADWDQRVLGWNLRYCWTEDYTFSNKILEFMIYCTLNYTILNRWLLFPRSRKLCFCFGCKMWIIPWLTFLFSVWLMWERRHVRHWHIHLHKCHLRQTLMAFGLVEQLYIMWFK